MNLKHHSQSNQAVERLVHDADLEIIPLRGVEAKLSAVAKSTTLTITCSPKLGLDRTLEYADLAVQAGYRVVPHLAARQIADEDELRDLLDRLTAIGIKDLYIVGGDAAEPAGKYSSAGDLLVAMSGIDHGFTSIGIACYPEGHPAISDENLLEALKTKQPYATYMVSQLCFDVDALVAWIRDMRAQGITLPLHIGLAAPLKPRKLLELSLKIGVGSSIRFLTKQHGMVGTVLRGSAYRPEKLLQDMGDSLTSTELGIEQVHLFSFNQVAATVEWQTRVSGPADEQKGGLR